VPRQTIERAERTGRPDWAGRPDRTGKPDKSGANGRARADRKDHADRVDRADRVDPAEEVRSQRALQNQKMPAAERNKARELVARFPSNYELDRNGALAVRGEVLATNLSEPALAAAGRAGFTIVRRTPVDQLGLSLVVLTHADWSVAKMISRLRRLAPEAAIEPDHIFFASGAKTRPVPARRAVRRAQESRAAPAPAWRLGVIDTGTAGSGPTQARVVRRGFAPGGFVPGDHGTAVAAIAAQHAADEGSRRSAGTIYIADIFGGGPGGGSAEQMVRALGWMAQEQVPVTNVSMVGPYNAVVASAISILARRGFLVVAPVGNDGTSANPLYPAALPKAIAVTAVDRRGAPLPEASRVRKVDFAAPGIATVADASGRTVEVRGTSFASPVVAHRLSELLVAPDPARAKAAVTSLSATAWQPQQGSTGASLGHGIVGLSPPRSR
jgi:minor extracellular protease Epr